MPQLTRSMMTVMAILVSSIGCVQYSHRVKNHPAEEVFPISPAEITEIQKSYKHEILDLDLFVKNELFDGEAPPDYYMTAWGRMQKAEITSLGSLQEFAHSQSVINNYNSQRLVLAMKSRQKTPLQIYRFLEELSRRENRVAELQSRCFTVLQKPHIAGLE